MTLPFVSFDDLGASAPADMAWMVEGLLAPGSITGLAAPPKLGKSTLLFAQLHASQVGSRFLGLATRPVSPVYLTEEGVDSLNEKRRRWPIDGSVLLRRDVLGVPWTDVVAAAVEHAKTHEHDVLVIDTLPPWAGLSGEGENSAGAMLEALKPLEHAAGAGLAVEVALHSRKSGGEFGEGVRGSNALVGVLDVLVELGREKESGASLRKLTTVSRFEATPESLRYRLVGDELQVLDTYTKHREAIRSLLATDPALGSNEIIEKLREIDLGGKREALLRLIREVELSVANRFPEGRNQSEPSTPGWFPPSPPLGGGEPPPETGSRSQGTTDTREAGR
jgi:hypothetical protein